MNKLLHIPPPIYGLLTLGLCKTLDKLLPLAVDISIPSLGAALALAGLGLLVWAWLQFFRNKTTPLPTGEPSALVETGPYRYSRNPMYLGFLPLLASVVFFTGAPVYLLSPWAFFLVVNRLFVPYEEAKLERLFGEAYAKMKLKVPRWL
jgi:protein-S-isoprenylcysteine O-methyltransferase Ste14